VKIAALLLAISLPALPPASGQDTGPTGRNTGDASADPGDMMADSPVRFPEKGALPPAFPPDLKPRTHDAGEPGYYLFDSPPRSLAQVREIQAAMPPGTFTPPPNNWVHLKLTRRALTEGGSLHIMAIGDSIVNDTMRSGWISLLRATYPGATITATVYVRGGGGCQHFSREGRIARHVVPREPDLVFIGGISQERTALIGAVIDEIRAARPETEFLLGTGAFGTTDPRHPGKLAAARHSGTGKYGGELRKLADQKHCAYLDFTSPWAEYLVSSGLHPHRFYRDRVHANAVGEQVLARIFMAFWSPQPDNSTSEIEFK